MNAFCIRTKLLLSVEFPFLNNELLSSVLIIESAEEIEKWVGAMDEELSKADIQVKRLQEWQNAVSRYEKQRKRYEHL